MPSQRPTQDGSPFLGASADDRLTDLTSTPSTRSPSPTPSPDVTRDQRPEADPPAWAPGDSDRDRTRCRKCGAHLSARYRRVWSERGDGTVDYCRECVPRSVRFGRDAYGRTPDDFGPGDFDVEGHNA